MRLVVTSDTHFPFFQNPTESRGPPIPGGDVFLHVGDLMYTGYASEWYHDLLQKPEWFFHGHIHESYGEHHEWGTSFYNVAMCDRDYRQVNAPVVLDL